MCDMKQCLCSGFKLSLTSATQNALTLLASMNSLHWRDESKGLSCGYATAQHRCPGPWQPWEQLCVTALQWLTQCNL